jgi:SAM-dependent methyltransferase
VHLYELPQSNLAIFQSGYFDCVYSTIVFMHLDKVEVFNYIREVYRLLAPGGRAYFDTYNLLAPQAWEEFVKIADSLPAWVRPGHVSQFSTPPEMRKYMEEAGFDPVHIDDTNPQLVVALGYKAAEDNVERPESAMNPNADMRTGAELAAIYLADTEPSVYNELMQVRQNVEAKNRYIEELERTLQQKNRHIEKLERLTRRQQRKLDTVPGRIVVRLTRGR